VFFFSFSVVVFVFDLVLGFVVGFVVAVDLTQNFELGKFHSKIFQPKEIKTNKINEKRKNQIYF
jgi:hypothetical protein